MFKLGSLFDGAGTCPFSAVILGMTPAWASEIEKFPVEVTTKRFPQMKHLGDITKINGAEIEPVDVITFGSPCQDLSVAGRREGLQGARSGLFMEAIRIIREMQIATDGLYPSFAIWENVPGAFSSNQGQDFRAVLEEIGDTEIPMPRSGKWATAGMVRTETADIAWRVLDAQYWGVPQRRKRIFLIADFRCRRSGEILFERQSLSGDSQTSREAGKEVTGAVGNSIAAASYWDGGQVSDCLDCSMLAKGQMMPEKRRFPVVLYDMTHADEVLRPVQEGLAPTLNSRMGTGGNQVPVMLAFTQNQRDEVRDLEGKSGAIAAKPGMKQQTFIVSNTTVDCRNLCENEELSGTLQGKPNGGQSLNFINPVRTNLRIRRLTPTECARLQGMPDWWCADVPHSDTAEYRMWGNGMALPCIRFVIEGVKKQLVSTFLDDLLEDAI